MADGRVLLGVNTETGRALQPEHERHLHHLPRHGRHGHLPSLVPDRQRASWACTTAGGRLVPARGRHHGSTAPTPCTSASPSTAKSRWCSSTSRACRARRPLCGEHTRRLERQTLPQPARDRAAPHGGRTLWKSPSRWTCAASACACRPRPPSHPDYGIMGLMHIIPPSLAWLWRLVAPRGFKNPSITGSSPARGRGRRLVLAVRHGPQGAPGQTSCSSRSSRAPTPATSSSQPAHRRV